MENIDVEVQGDILIIRVDLSKTIGPSSTGRNMLIASSRGNVTLHDGKGYRRERLNMSVSRPLTKKELDEC